MGDMADYYNELAWDYPDGDEWTGPYERTVRCKYCQRPNFVWRRTSDGWRLYTARGERLHVCSAYAAQQA